MPADTIDRTRLLPRSGVGVLAPWLVIAPGTDQQIRLDLRLLDRVEVIESEEHLHLLLVCGDLEIAVFVADGDAATRQIAEKAAVHTGQTTSGDLDRFVVVDDDAVVLRGERLQVGEVAFRVDQVREYALRGANIPLPRGRVLQAAMALLVVAAAERAAAA